MPKLHAAKRETSAVVTVEVSVEVSVAVSVVVPVDVPVVVRVAERLVVADAVIVEVADVVSDDVAVVVAVVLSQPMKSKLLKAAIAAATNRTCASHDCTELTASDEPAHSNVPGVPCGPVNTPIIWLRLNARYPHAFETPGGTNGMVS